jgi:hypothetical protein
MFILDFIAYKLKIETDFSDFCVEIMGIELSAHDFSAKTIGAFISEAKLYLDDLYLTAIGFSGFGDGTKDVEKSGKAVEKFGILAEKLKGSEDVLISFTEAPKKIKLEGFKEKFGNIKSDAFNVEKNRDLLFMNLVGRGDEYAKILRDTSVMARDSEDFLTQFREILIRETPSSGKILPEESEEEKEKIKYQNYVGFVKDIDNIANFLRRHKIVITF